MIGQVVVRVISSSPGNVVYILRAIRLHQHDVTVQPILVGVARRSGSACVSSIALIGDTRCCKRSQHHAAHHGTDKSETDNKFCLFHDKFSFSRYFYVRLDFIIYINPCQPILII